MSSETRNIMDRRPSAKTEAKHAAPAKFDEAAFDEAVSHPSGWDAVADPVAEIRRMRDGVPANVAALREDDANLSSWDGVDAQIDALKRLARTRVGGCECAMPCAEFADIVERLDAARKRELASTCNAAVTRRWLKTIRNMSEHNDNDLGNTVVRGLLDQLTRIHTCAREALSAPARNCDRLDDADAARAAVKSEFANTMLLDNKQLRAICDWLFAKAEGGAE